MNRFRHFLHFLWRAHFCIPRTDAQQVPHMNDLVFTQDLVYLDWSEREWDAAECARDVAALARGKQKLRTASLAEEGG